MVFPHASEPRIPISEVEWRRRHKGLLVLLAVHLVGLPLFGLAEGWGLGTGLALDVPIAVLGVMAAVARFGQTARATFAVLGLLCCSAALVWLWHGTIEAHFHYFVIVGAVALYEAWLPYAIAFVFVIVQHWAMSVWVPDRVFNHMGAMHDPWMWALIHGGFIGALAVANLVSWSASNDVRRRERTALADALRSTERFGRAFSGAPTGAALVKADGSIVEANQALASAVGRTTAELVHLSLFDLLPEDERASAKAQWPPPDGGPERERRMLRSDGTTGWMLWKHSALSGESTDSQWISQAVDVSARKQAEEKLAYQAEHDLLTGLLSRDAFEARLDETLREDQDGVALVFADIDNFKIVNDSLGHRAGDALLIEVSDRLQKELGTQGFMGRFGGDEFITCVAGFTDPDEARALSERLSLSLQRPFKLDGVERFVTASFGLAVATGPVQTTDALLRDADLAMYRSKALGKSRTTVFEAGMRRDALDRLELEAKLRDALTDRALSVHYQPQVRLSDGHVTGVEALARWEDGDAGFIPPGVFIPIAEQSGLVSQIGAFVMHEACQQLVDWTAADPALADMTVSVNMSPRCLANRSLPDDVAGILSATGLEPRRLCIEITETAIVNPGERTMKVLRDLKAIGVLLAIDDFGIGQSSLAQLGRLGAVDEVKIDKLFVDELLNPEDALNRAVIGAVLDIARSLDLNVVAEGIEHEEQARQLREYGCPVAQGYLFARPQTPEATWSLISAAAMLEGVKADKRKTGGITTR